MTRLFLLPSFLLAFAVAQDAGLYINKIAINGRFDDAKKYTYFVDDNYDAVQPDNFKGVAQSIGRLYEDDYSPDNAQCTTTECPKLRKLWSYLKTDAGKVTYTRIVDDLTRKSMGVTGGKAMGYVAPYPGYCNSDDTLPIIELYSAADDKYAYWSPLNANEFVNKTIIDRTRYVPTRLVGYALTHAPLRLILTGKTPDFQVTGKANYTHSFHPTQNIYDLVKDGESIFVSKESVIETQLGKGYTMAQPMLNVLAPTTGNNGVELDKVCPRREYVFGYNRNDDSNAWRLYLTSENSKAIADGYKPTGNLGQTFQGPSVVCGGIKGLGKIVEFQHKTRPHRYTYAADPVKIAELAAGPWTQTTHNLGYVSIDDFGFVFIHKTIPITQPYV